MWLLNNKRTMPKTDILWIKLTLTTIFLLGLINSASGKSEILSKFSRNRRKVDDSEQRKNRMSVCSFLKSTFRFSIFPFSARRSIQFWSKIMYIDSMILFLGKIIFSDWIKIICNWEKLKNDYWSILVLFFQKKIAILSRKHPLYEAGLLFEHRFFFCVTLLYSYENIDQGPYIISAIRTQTHRTKTGLV
jgi:hypothetical protein